MPRSFYEVVVVGGSLAALTTGALLARRGFRVAVIGHGARGDSYTHDGLALRRGSAFAPWLEAPAFLRAMNELALVPTVRRRAQTREVAWQVVLPRHRLDVHVDPERRLAELDREFPEVHRPVEDFYAALARHHPLLDRTFGADVPWPPDGFFERRAVRRASTDHPFGADGLAGDILAEFAADHPVRTVVDAQARFAGAHDPDRMTALARTRLHAAGLRACTLAEGGADGLRRVLEERIQQHGGDVRTRERVERIGLKRGRVETITLAGSDEELGCGFVVTSLDAAAAQRLTGAPASRGYAARMLGARPRYYRYALNVALPAEVLPVGMGPRVFAVADLKRPLAEENLLAVEYGAADAQGRVVLTACALLPRPAVEEGEVYMHRVRARVLQALESVVPFLDRHAMVIDSPHDGLPLEDRARAEPVPIEARWSGAAEPMESLDERPSDAFFGVGGLPMTGDIAGMLHVGRQMVPGIGEEGEFLAALTAAARITRTDRGKERMRREIWREG
jgi:phytoene dehydrogenase-like protein